MKIGTIARTWAALIPIGFAAGHLQGVSAKKEISSSPASI
jgi:hypothetical protein